MLSSLIFIFDTLAQLIILYPLPNNWNLPQIASSENILVFWNRISYVLTLLSFFHMTTKLVYCVLKTLPGADNAVVAVMSTFPIWIITLIVWKVYLSLCHIVMGDHYAVLAMVLTLIMVATYYTKFAVTPPAELATPMVIEEVPVSNVSGVVFRPFSKGLIVNPPGHPRNGDSCSSLNDDDKDSTSSMESELSVNGSWHTAPSLSSSVVDDDEESTCSTDTHRLMPIIRNRVAPDSKTASIPLRTLRSGAKF